MSPRTRQADELLAEFGWEIDHCRHVCRLAAMLFDQLQPLHELTGSERDILEAAALLHDLGWTISRQAHHKHSARLIRANAARLPDFAAAEVELIANVARYHRKALPSSEHEAFAALPPVDQRIVKRLAALLRLADGLDRPHWQAVTDVSCDLTDRHVLVAVKAAVEAGAHIEGAARKADLFEMVYGIPVEFTIVSP